MSPPEASDLVLHRAVLPYATHPTLQGFAPGHLHLAGLEALWVRLEDGTRVDKPRGPLQTVETRFEPLPEPSTELTRPWEAQLEGDALSRHQDTGAGFLLEGSPQARSGRTLWWAHEGQVHPLVGRVPWEVRIESVGQGHGVWVDPKAGTLELLAPQERRRWRVALPAWLSEGIRALWRGNLYRFLWSVPELGVLVFSSHYAIAWVALEALQTLPHAPEVCWRTVEHHPLADLSARMGGEIVFTGATSVVVNLEDQTQLRLPPQKGLSSGQRVFLVGRLSSASGRAEYLWLEHGGQRWRLAPEPPGAERFPVESRALGKAAKKRARSP